MNTTEEEKVHTDYKIADAQHPLWLGGSGPLRAEGKTAGELLAAADLDWTVKPQPLYLNVSEYGQQREVTGFVANTRSDNGAFLGIVGAGWRAVGNEETLELAEAIVESGGAQWLSAGSTRGGAHVHAVLRLPQDISAGGLDSERVLPLLRVSNGHDGGMALTVTVAPMRLACLNGMLLPVPGAVRSWKGRHTANIERKLDEARRALQLGADYYQRLAMKSDELVLQKMTSRQFGAFVERLVPYPADVDVEQGGRRVDNVERVRDAIRRAEQADDAANVRGTRWGALQAVTRYVTHDQTIRRTSGRTERDAQFERITSVHNLVDRAYALLA